MRVLDIGPEKGPCLMQYFPLHSSAPQRRDVLIVMKMTWIIKTDDCDDIGVEI